MLEPVLDRLAVVAAPPRPGDGAPDDGTDSDRGRRPARHSGLRLEDAVGELARVARAAGYDAIETKARRGWSKMAGKYNFRPVHVAYEMELNDGTR